MNGPTMIRQAARYRRCPCKPFMTSNQSWQSEAFVLRAEVVDAPHKIHPRLQGFTSSGQGSCASGQAVQTTAKRAIDALNEGGVDIACTLRQFDQLSDCFFCSSINLPTHANDAMACILLDHLRDQNIRPLDEATSSGLLARLFLTKDFQNRRRITRQAIGAEEHCPAQRRGTAFDAEDELLDQFAVSMLTDFSAQPQTGRDLDGHAHPDDGTLDLNAQFIGLDLSQWPRLLDQMLMHLLRVLAALLKPVVDRSLVEAEGRDNRLHRAAEREQGDHQGDEIGGFSQAVKYRSRPSAEGLAALVADVAVLLLGMHPDVTFPDLSSGGTVEIGTKCGVWGQWRFFFLIRHKEIVA